MPVLREDFVLIMDRAVKLYRRLERVVKRRKQLAVQRHLRIADQYIGNVVLGAFPKRKAR